MGVLITDPASACQPQVCVRIAPLATTRMRSFVLLQVLLLCLPMLSASQGPELLWTSTGTSLPKSVEFANTVNFDNSIFVVGGCADPECVETTTLLSSYDTSMQTISTLSFQLPIGIAGYYSTVAAPRRVGSARSLFILRSCSMCFAGPDGRVYPSTNFSSFPDSYDPSEFFAGIGQVDVNRSAARGSEFRYTWNATAGSLPARNVRCNASCVVYGLTVFILGGIRVDDAKNEVTFVDSVDISENLATGSTVFAFQSNVSQLPSEMTQLRRLDNRPVNEFNSTFICSLGASSSIGVASNNQAVFFSTVCWDHAIRAPQMYVMLFAWYPYLAMLEEKTMLFANESIASSLTPPTFVSIVTFASQLLCMGGDMIVALDFVFANHPISGAAVGQVNDLLMVSSQVSGHTSFHAEAELVNFGAMWTLYSFGGLDDSGTATESIVQTCPTELGIAAPLELIVSTTWSSQSGLGGNITYQQFEFGSIVMQVGQNLTVRLNELATSDFIMLSPFTDCSKPLQGTVALPVTAIETTFEVSVAAEVVFVCISDGTQILAGTSDQGTPQYVLYFSPTNAGSAFEISPASTPTTAIPTTTSTPSSTANHFGTTTSSPIAPTTANPATPTTAAPSPATTTAAPAPGPATHWAWIPTWLPDWSAVVVLALAGLLLLLLVAACCYRLREQNIMPRGAFSHRDVIALENITNSNKYTVIRRLGSGGNGEVFLVKRKKDGELCAIKHVRCHGNKTREDLFRESDVLDRLKGHPNMVEILEMSLHEVYIEEEDLPDSEFTDDEDADTFLVSEKTATDERSQPAIASANTTGTNVAKRRRRRRSATSTGLLGGESIASTGPMGLDRDAAVEAGLAVKGDNRDVDVERIATTTSDGETERFLAVRNRAKARRRSRKTKSETSSTIALLRDEASGEEAKRVGSEQSSGVDEHKRSARRLIADTSAPQTPGNSKKESDVSASSYYQSLNGDDQPRATGRRVRYQCIVMRYFRRGDLATFVEQQIPHQSSVRASERRGSLFGALIRKSSQSRDDVTSVGHQAGHGRNGEDIDGGGSAIGRNRKLASEPQSAKPSTPTPGTGGGGGGGGGGGVLDPTPHLEVRLNAGGGGSDSDDPSNTSRNASDDDRNVAPTTEPNAAGRRRLERTGSEGNFSQSSLLHQQPLSGSGNVALNPLREDIVVSIIYQVSALLRYLHSRKPHRIVHCDIKPENILVADSIHPLYLQMLGGQAAHAMSAASSVGSVGRSPSRLFSKYLQYGGTSNELSPHNNERPVLQSFGKSSTVAGGAVSRKTLHHHRDASNPYFIGQSQKSSLPSTPLSINGVVTPMGELIATALEDVFLPVVVSDVGQAMEVPLPDVPMPPLAGGLAAPASTASAAVHPSSSATPSAGNTLRLVQCTMPYVAPECIASGLRCVSPAIDIWALGCVIYSICTRRLKNTDVVVMFEEVRKPTFEEDMRFEMCDVLGYSQSLAALMLAMLNPDPALRPSAADITNSWMSFVPHAAQNIVQGVMKIQVSVPGSAVPLHPGSVSSATRRLIVAA